MLDKAIILGSAEKENALIDWHSMFGGCGSVCLAVQFHSSILAG